jgi:fluoride exporter
MFGYLMVAVGGALGSVARFWLSDALVRKTGSGFPWGTIAVNITGSLLIGFLAALAEPGGRRYLNPTGQLFFMYGICGGYTTFSSFSLQTLRLAQAGQWFEAAGNVLLSVVLCMVAVWLGYLLGTAAGPVKGN